MADAPVRPRHAASLVLIDDSEDRPKILMGKRHARMSFIPDAFVFPGGKLDPQDLQPATASDLDRETLGHLRAGGTSEAQARALALAAIRETFEETGLVISAPGDIGENQEGTWQQWKQSGWAPRLDPLRFIARAITPPESPIRFHARFFAAPASVATGTLKGSGELSDLDWYPIDEALKLPIIDVTEFVLQEIRDRVERPRPPLYCYRNGKPKIVA